MKHLIFTFFLIILGLGQEYAHAQDNASTSQPSTPPVAEQNERPAEEGNNKEETNIQQADNNSSPLIIDKDVGGKEVSTLSASDKIAEKARFWSMVQTFIGAGTLFLAGLATVFACGAWLESRKGVKVTQEATKAEYRPYAKVSDITLHGNPEKIRFVDKKHAILHGQIKVQNCGRSPIYLRSVSGNMTVFPRGIDLPHFNVSMGNSRQESEIAPNAKESLTLFMSFKIPEELGISELDINSFIFHIRTLVKFDDMFSISTEKYRYFRTEHNGIFTPVMENGNNIYGPFDRMVHSIEIKRIDTFINREDIHESKKPENQPKQKTLGEFFNEGNRTVGDDSEA